MGLTATEAATARAVASRAPGAMISDPFAEPLVRALGVEFFSDLAQHGDNADRSAFAMPGMVDWITARTRYFDEFFIATQGTGIRQAVILGAGLDSRAFRLAWDPGATVYEVDQPGVIEFKSATMTYLNAFPCTLLRTVSVDLRGDWVTSLVQQGFDPSVPTAWSAEGLLPYLPVEAQERLLDGICVLSAEGSWLAADTVSDTGELAARITRFSGAKQRPADAQISIGTAIADSAGAQPDTARRLSPHGWASMSFGALELLGSYGISVQGAPENIYELIDFVIAVRGLPSGAKVAGI